MTGYRINLSGKRFGRLIVKTFSHITEGGSRIWICICDCGKEKAIASGSLRRGLTTSCGCFHKEQTSLPFGQSSFNRLFRQYKRNAKIAGIKFELSKEEFKTLIDSDCYYCGLGPARIAYLNPRQNGSYTFNGIDKLDPKKGYVIDNLVPCCWEHNRMKGTLTELEFANQIKILYNYLSNKGVI